MNASLSAEGVELSALNGANPLGFLTALGTLVTLRQAGNPDARLGWRRTVHWTPVLHGLVTNDLQKIAQVVAAILLGKEVSPKAEVEREVAQSEFDAAKKAFKDKLAEIKKRKLKGAERTAAREKEVAPLEHVLEDKRETWLGALKRAVPSEELALGKHIDCTPVEFRDRAVAFLATATHPSRQSVDFLSAFGSDARSDKFGRIVSTPFCFITGSGHQYFLDTIRQLIEKATPERVYQALFRPWEYRDEKFSMRWDPVEDRRYALMDRDPTTADNKSRTVWMANLLAYRSLLLLPSAVTVHGSGNAGWRQTKSGPEFTWPIWEQPLRPEVIQSLVQLNELQTEEIGHQHARALGIVAVFRSRRIQVGNPPLHKINFTPARSV